MTMLPRELTEPFPSNADRAEAHRRLVLRDHTLLAIEELAGQPPGRWSQFDMDRFPKQTSGVPDPPPVRLSRWASLFADELAEVHRLAKRPLLSDIELRQAHYLAGRLLATVTDLPLKDVDSFEL